MRQCRKVDTRTDGTQSGKLDKKTICRKHMVALFFFRPDTRIACPGIANRCASGNLLPSAFPIPIPPVHFSTAHVRPCGAFAGMVDTFAPERQAPQIGTYGLFVVKVPFHSCFLGLSADFCRYCCCRKSDVV